MDSGRRAAARATARATERGAPTWTSLVPVALCVLLAVGLSGYAVALVSGALPTGHRHGGWAASIGVLLMTAPLAWAWRRPAAAAAGVGSGAVGNAILFGSMVRCGPAVPAVFVIAACLGYARWSRSTAVGGAFLLLSLTVQTFDDPDLGSSTFPMLIAIAAAFGAIGRLVGSRRTAVATLRRRNNELIEQRDRAAALAREIERERVAGQLSATLRDALGHIGMVAAAGRATFDVDHDGQRSPALAREAFADVEGIGREALSRMRSVLQGLRDESR